MGHWLALRNVVLKLECEQLRTVISPDSVALESVRTY